MMHSKFDIIIADTSCLILLSKIDELNLLKELFKTITITKIIEREYNSDLPDWIQIIDNSNDKVVSLLELEIDKGEASAISLALESANHLLIVDDLKARKLAEKLNLNYVGTIGILLKAIQIGLVEDKRILTEKLMNTNFHFSKELIDLLLS